MGVNFLSIITSIFQAIFQALTFILPVSESGHSAIFHDFAGRYTSSCSELTGLIHLGIALGIIIACYKVFMRLIYEFMSTLQDVFGGHFQTKKVSTSRKFMYLTFIPYILMLIYLIPVGDGKNIYEYLNSVSYDTNLFGEGIFFLITATLLLAANIVLNKNKNGKALTLPYTIIAAVLIFLSIPLPGLSLSASIICILIICGVNKKVAFRYFVSISVPVLIFTGIMEILNCATYVKIVPGIIAVVISAAVTFFISKLLLNLISKNNLKIFSYYCYTIGVIITVIGIVEIFIR